MPPLAPCPRTPPEGTTAHEPDRATRDALLPAAASPERIALGSARLDNVTMPEAIARICALVAAGRPEYVVTPNVDHLVKLEDDPQFRAVYDEAALVLADGMPLLWASRLLGTPLRAKVSGSDLFVEFAAEAARRGLRLYFLGGRSGAAARAAEVLTERFPGLVVCGIDSPPFGFDRDDRLNGRVLARIRAARPDVLFVGLGAPKQEKWIHRWRHETGVPVSIGVGVSFEFVAGLVRRAPRLLQGMGLEWAWRLLMEPRRLWRRYLVEDTRFVWLFLRQWARTRRRASVPATAGPSPLPGWPLGAHGVSCTRACCAPSLDPHVLEPTTLLTDHQRSEAPRRLEAPTRGRDAA